MLPVPIDCLAVVPGLIQSARRVRCDWDRPTRDGWLGVWEDAARESSVPTVFPSLTPTDAEEVS